MIEKIPILDTWQKENEWCDVLVKKINEIINVMNKMWYRVDALSNLHLSDEEISMCEAHKNG